MFLFLALLSDVLSAVWAASAWGEHRLVVRCLRALPVVSLSEQEVARAAGGVASPLPFFAFAIPSPKTANQSRKKKENFLLYCCYGVLRRVNPLYLCISNSRFSNKNLNISANDNNSNDDTKRNWQKEKQNRKGFGPKL